MTDSVPLLVAAGLVLAGFVAFFVVFVVLLVRWSARTSRYGGVMGALYGGRVGPTFGELEAAPRGALATVRLRVVGLNGEAPGVGLEIHVQAKAGFAVRAVRMTYEEAARVAGALEEAAR